jgi:glycine oxidase
MGETVIYRTAPVRIVGQGLAGTLLGWACEQRGIAFRIFDRGHEESASRVGAGLVSPLTGQRLVPTWKFAEWRTRTLAIYAQLEAELTCPLVRHLRLRRLFRSEQEREKMRARLDVPAVAAWVESADEHGLWLHGAFQVNTARLITAMRTRWVAKGWLRQEDVKVGIESDEPTIWCVGAGVRDCTFARARWELSKGELLTGHMTGIEDDVVLNDGQWVLPLGAGRVRVGATFGRDDLTLTPSAKADQELRAAAERLGGGPIADVTIEVGVRVNLPDRRPMVGWTDVGRQNGVFAGLAAKGALWAPVLAEQWAADDLGGMQVDCETRPNR